MPELLVDDQPSIVEAMEGVGFHTTDQPGIYRKNTATAQVGQVDLLVPRSVGGRRGRGADLGPHGTYAAMQVHGLEGALLSHMPIAIRSLEKDDPRKFDIRVAGPGALVVAKMHKIAERHSGNRRDRLDNKDAFDAYRILRAVESDSLAGEFHAMLDGPTAREVVAEASVLFGEYFGNESAVGTLMVGEYVEGLEDPQFYIASSVALSVDLLRLIS